MNLLKIATSENAYKRLLGDNGVDSTKARAPLTSILCVAATCAMMGFLAGYLLVRHEDSRALYGLGECCKGSRIVVRATTEFVKCQRIR